MEEFLKKYKLFDTKKLLIILEKPEDYQRMAVLAAEIELESRTVCQAEINEVKKEIKAEKEELEKAAIKLKTTKEKAKSIGDEFFKTISPMQVELQPTNRKINLVLFCLVVLSIVSLIEHYGLFDYTLYLSDRGIDSSILLIFFFALLPIITTPLWGLRKKAGWILLSFHLVTILTGSIISAFIGLCRWLNLKFIYQDPSNVDFRKAQIIYIDDPIQNLAFITIFLGFLWFISQPDIKAVFKIERKTAILTFGLAFIIAFLMRIFII